MFRNDRRMPGWLRSVLMIALLLLLVYGGMLLRGALDGQAEKRESAAQTQQEDIFDAKRYPDAQAFYADHADDFADYEEAEDYWYEHA